MKLIIDFYKDLNRQGPGSDEQTKKALRSIHFQTDHPQIADIGCGTGAQTETLAGELHAEIIAVDFLEAFLQKLKKRFETINLPVKTLCADMSDLPFSKHAFDLIWSEGAVYNMGFEQGIRYWNQFIKPDGFLALTELSWLTDERPPALDDYWKHAYPGIGTITRNIGLLEQNGYCLTDHFTLPSTCWTANYYKPIQENMAAFLNRWNHAPEAQALVRENEQEMQYYEKYHTYYGYTFYIAQKKNEVIK